MDLRTGALLARPADGGGSGAYDYVLPIGFYTQFDPYLTTNLSQLNELKSQGINIVCRIFFILASQIDNGILHRFRFMPYPPSTIQLRLTQFLIGWKRSDYISCTTCDCMPPVFFCFYSGIPTPLFSTYMNSSSVTSQVNSIKSRSNLLLWYTGDEPDGTSDPLNATLNSANLIVSLDGGVAGNGVLGVGYHPVSLVLNCQNYYFT